MESPAPIELRNPDATGPVVVSVPHAGRDYGAWTAQLRPPAEKLLALEDRHADALVAAVSTAPVLVARLPRAYVDLNRHEAELDPGMVEGAIASRLILSPKVRSGLGVIPRKLAGIGDVWRSRLSMAEVQQRLDHVHRPYHRALKRLLQDALDRHGVAVLLDLHSMPSVAPANGEPAPAIVIGNRYGQSAGAWATSRLGGLCMRSGWSFRENSPYAGGYIIERHGAPLQGIHALQIEVDRALYLDDLLENPDLARIGKAQALVAAMVAELSIAALASGLPLAAE